MNANSRILGGLYGSLVGDALGVPVEFSSRQSRRADPVTHMRAFGVWNQPAGTWSDDGSLLLCSVASLAEQGFNPEDMGAKFVKWCDYGYWAAHGRVFDIGQATRCALDRISLGSPALQAGGMSEQDNGNGSLMRILPMSLLPRIEPETFLTQLEQASCITHAHARSQMACAFHGLLTQSLLKGETPTAALHEAQRKFGERYQGHAELAFFSDLLRPDLGELEEGRIRSGGYVIDTLAASLWCLLRTRSFNECVLDAVNLGGDTDTTGCVAGGLAGVHYGLEAIPQDWLHTLPQQEELKTLFADFCGRFGE
jgi:ADP-ribosylglycohydrolase